jgi:ferredoxin
MTSARRNDVAFHVGGGSIQADQKDICGQALIPALAARYRDLSALRYDFPVVLLNGGDSGIRPLSVIVDDLLRGMPAGEDAARVALHVLDLERHIRAAVARGERGLLSALWDRTAARVAGHSELRQDSVGRARAALTVDGEVVDCDATLPARVLQHCWQTRHAEKGRQFLAHVGRLVLQLGEILRAEFGHSAGGRTSEALRASIGGPLQQAFDFEAMARVLATSTPACTIDDSRRRRLHGLIATLRAQQFYPAADQVGLGFSFDSCVAALRAYRERLPLVVDLVSALGAAELEATGEYTAARHDAFFDELRSGLLLDPRDMSLFPDYFVRLKAAAIDPLELDALLDVVGHRLPIRVLIEMDDLLPASIPGDEAGGQMRARHIARIATSLGRAFVLQVPGSLLARAQDEIARGFARAGPTLFSIFTGASTAPTGLSPYLLGALALESRVFPAFVCDPDAGAEAATVDLLLNPQAAADWPAYELEYEAGDHQRAADPVTLTAADFVACDARHARHFARVDRSVSSEGLVPLERWLALDAAARRGAVPFLWMVDTDNRLQRVIVDAAVVREVEAVQEQWRGLRQLGRAAPSPETRVVAPADGPAAESPELTVVITAASEAAGERPPAAAAERGTGDPYIETPRCSSCNECINLNGRMFRYNDNGQAYIGNPDAGTFRELVEAAESCQVAIIHPGSPRRPDEPGLEELLVRAAAFQ